MRSSSNDCKESSPLTRSTKPRPDAANFLLPCSKEMSAMTATSGRSKTLTVSRELGHVSVDDVPPVVRKKSIPTEFRLNSECDDAGRATDRTRDLAVAISEGERLP